MYLAKEQHKQVIVETHSEHVVDRIRMEVREQKGVSCEDVVILYFEQQQDRAAIHPMHLDARGDIVDAPEGYGQFFLDEERRLLGV